MHHCSTRQVFSDCARTHDMPAMIRCLDHWATAAPRHAGRTLWGWPRPSHLSSINLARGFAAEPIVRVPQGHEGSTHLQTSVPSLGFEPRSFGSTVSVTDLYT
ncbi:hypothetical protein TNCV_5112901 [Trichonephila clavipes]|nr:hypothetical protein TNCV_5112901 [Trichonephila clavipes]